MARDDEKTVLLGQAVGPTVMLPRQGAQLVRLPRRNAPMRVAGGGPVGLAFACSPKTMLGDQVSVRVFDRRWKRHAHRVVWKNAADGDNRREQVVALQSNVWAALPAEVQQRLFVRRPASR